ncbi:MAG: hypothetical protein U5K38_17560 [Woeseiaceae bacterium]|nr:hypothetical protein [Woeseiaceae bacterium]
MSSLLSDKFNSNKLSISQIPGTPSAETLNGLDQLLLLLPEKVPAPLWNKIPQGTKFKALLKRRQAGSVPSQSSRINNKRQTAVHIGQANTGSDIFDDLTLARKLVAAALTEKPVIVGVWVLGFDDDRQQRIAECTVAAAMAAAFTMPTFKKDRPKPPIKGIRLIGMDERIDLRRIEAEASGNNLARWLTSLPPNKLDGYEYVKVLRDLAREQGWQFKKYGLAELAKMGAGAFLAVAQGNEDDSASMVRLRLPS